MSILAEVLKKALLRGLIYGVLLAAFLVYLFTWFADDLLYPVSPGRPPANLEPFRLEVAPGVTISAVYLAAEHAEYTVLYSHGNGEQLADIEHLITLLNRRGFAVAAYDYEGYGMSGGKPGEKELYRDIRAVYDYLVKTEKVPPEKIIVWGFSLGSGPSCELAAGNPVGGLILEAPFTSAFGAIGADFLPFDRFDNLSKMPKIKCPVLIMNGSLDQVVSPEQGAQLCVNAGGVKIYRKLGLVGHNDLSGHEDYWDYIDRFIEKAVGPYSAELSEAREKSSE